jgi:hypothetical protein
MLARNSYDRDYIAASRARVEARLAAHRDLKAAADGTGAVAAFEPLFYDAKRTTSPSTSACADAGGGGSPRASYRSLWKPRSSSACESPRTTSRRSWSTASWSPCTPPGLSVQHRGLLFTDVRVVAQDRRS